MLKILYPKIFDQAKIISGVTLKNDNLFPPLGFTISKSDIINDVDLMENRKYLAENIGVDTQKMIFLRQIHSDKIINFTNINTNLEGDAAITNFKGFIINISIADCAAILIYDKANQVVCGIHSGWKGTHEKIAVKTIENLIQIYNSEVSNLLIYISPCAGMNNYEVGAEFLDYFPLSTTVNSSGKIFFDNRKEILLQLKKINIPDENIEISEICTIENKDFHSFRRDGKFSGRMSAFIGMK